MTTVRNEIVISEVVGLVIYLLLLLLRDAISGAPV
jgi:hypothetical protein